MIRDVPNWVAPLLAGLASGLLVALLNVRHQRTEGIRDRMLTAADEFSTGMGQALMAARHLEANAENALNVNGALAPVSESLKEARRCLDEADARSARVMLLFGVTSSANAVAVHGVAALRAYLADYEDWPPHDDAIEGLQRADEAYILFNDRARRAIENYGKLIPVRRVKAAPDI
jgi:hypothetical protein